MAPVGDNPRGSRWTFVSLPIGSAGYARASFRGRGAPESVQIVAIPRCNARDDSIDQTSRATIDRSGPYGVELRNEKYSDSSPVNTTHRITATTEPPTTARREPSRVLGA